MRTRTRAILLSWVMVLLLAVVTIDAMAFEPDVSNRSAVASGYEIGNSGSKGPDGKEGDGGDPDGVGLDGPASRPLTGYMRFQYWIHTVTTVLIDLGL